MYRNSSYLKIKSITYILDKNYKMKRFIPFFVLLTGLGIIDKSVSEFPSHDEDILKKASTKQYASNEGRENTNEKVGYVFVNELYSYSSTT